MFSKPASTIYISKKTFLMSYASTKNNQESGDVSESAVPYDVTEKDLHHDDDDTRSLTVDSLEEEDFQSDQRLEEEEEEEEELSHTTTSAQNEDIFIANDYFQTQTANNRISDDPPEKICAPNSSSSLEMSANSPSPSPGDKDSEPTESFPEKTQTPSKSQDSQEATSLPEHPQPSHESSERSSDPASNNGDSGPEILKMAPQDGGARDDSTNGTRKKTSPSCCESGNSTLQEDEEAEGERNDLAPSHESPSPSEDSCSTASSSQKNVRRSGIPRRMPSEQSGGNQDPEPITETSSPSLSPSPQTSQRSLATVTNTADLSTKKPSSSGNARQAPEELKQTPANSSKKTPAGSRSSQDILKKSLSLPEEAAQKSLSRVADSPSSSTGSPSGGGVGGGGGGPFGGMGVEEWGRWEKRHSLCETMSVMSASGAKISGPVCRDTIASRLRIEKQHQCHELNHEHHHHHNGSSLDTMGPGGGAGGGCARSYLTPSQRKDLTIRELKAQVFQMTRQLDAREHQLQELRETSLEEKQQIRSQLEEALGLAETAQQEVSSVQDSHKENVKLIQNELRKQLKEALELAKNSRKEAKKLQESHEESVKLVAVLQQELDDVKKEMARRLARAEEIFLEMYKKGKDSAIFEREEELELQGKDNQGMNATEAELRNKLLRTQAELAKWQTIQRHDSYHATPLPATSAESTLAFLKDSMYHFLTSEKVQTSDEHLRAVVRILDFSKADREKVAQAIVTKRNKALL